MWLDVYDHCRDEIDNTLDETNDIHKYIGKPFTDDMKRRLKELDDWFYRLQDLKKYSRERILKYS